MIENGILGCKRDIIIERTRKIIPQLLEDGFELKSVIPYYAAGAPMQNGQSAHVTDVVTQYASRQVLQGTDPVIALANSFQDIPIEAIGLFLTAWGRFASSRLGGVLLLNGNRQSHRKGRLSV